MKFSTITDYETTTNLELPIYITPYKSPGPN